MLIYKTYRHIICCHICLLDLVTCVCRFFQAKPPAAVPATVVINNDATVEDAEDFGSESSEEMKVRDQRHLEMMCWINPPFTSRVGWCSGG